LGHAADVFTSVPGDLLLTVDVKPHELFRTEGRDIHSKVELSLCEAILGCKVTIATAHGPLNIEVPAGSCTGSRITIKHMGMPQFDLPEDSHSADNSGDHIVTIEVVLGDETDLVINQKRDQLLMEFLAIEARSKLKFYAYYETLRNANRQQASSP
jgi:DnaJ-class molecular chaperone